MKKEQKHVVNIYSIIVFTVLIIYTLTVLIPILWGIMTSFKAENQMWYGSSLFELPSMSYWDDEKSSIFGNYLNFFSNATAIVRGKYSIGLTLSIQVNEKFDVGFLDFIINTLLYVGGSALFSAMAPCLMAYICTRFQYKFNKVIYTFVLFVMIMPVFGTTSAMIVLMRRLCLFDTAYGMWIKSFSFANSHFLIYYAMFKSMSNTYAEAAEIDGASCLRTMCFIYFPLVIKTISTIFLLQFFALFNDYNSVLLYLPTMPTLSTAVYLLSTGQNPMSSPESIAAAMVLSLPMLILFVLFKKKLMGDISFGGIKE